jgi:GTP cyclohydrolase FolE2
MSLPRHQRSRRSFAGTFERDREETIAAMDRGGHDIPNQAPATPLGLRNVGVKRRAIPVLLQDPFGGAAPVQLSCEVQARVALEPGRRGIHVSRIGDILAQLSSRQHPSLLDYALAVNKSLRYAQKSKAASVSVHGTLTYLEKISGVKEKQSLEHLELLAGTTAAEGRLISSAGLGFSHITACPCVQETYRNSFADSFALIRARKQIPLITHTQRCRTRVQLTNAREFPGLPEWLACIDAVVVRNQNTLPREFELLSVHRAHAKPQFLEDVLRDLMRALHGLVRNRAPEATIRIEARSMESIHDFDMEGEIEFSVRELDTILRHKNGAALNGTISLNGVRHHAIAPPLSQKAGRKKPGRPLPMKRSPHSKSSRR